MTSFLLTTHAGLEPVLVEELAARLPQRPTVIETEPGRVTAELDASARPILMRLRSAHHVLEYVARRPLERPVTLDGVATAMAGVRVPGLAEVESFRVRSVRRGRHDFNHMAVERAAGAVLHAETGVRVDLTAPALTVRVDLVDDVLWVGVLLTQRTLSRRPKVYAQRIGLSADLAYAAVHVAELHRPERILDPFCGSGTLLLEAGAVLEDCELWASDWVRSAVAGTRTNLEAAGLSDRARVREQDALRMAEVYPAGAFDAIVTNPPFGVKMGPRIDFFRFYRRLLEQADAVLKPDGRLALWVHRHRQLASSVAKHGGFRAYRTLTVQAGGARPSLVALRRK